jgi:hypothetical protein
VNKFRNKKTNGYASKKEANRAAELKLLEKAGVILELREQYKFELIPKQEGERSVCYIADFVYYDNEKKCSVVEDVKGMKTRDYIIKRKLFQQKYGYRITEI